jgi:eukaryotic-like serine/threonine-protein kinase
LKKLGKYEILGELGHGAMGVVYRARDPFINRFVALKTITTGVADDPALLERFYREAQSAGGLQHPNIVTIYDMGDDQHVPYIAMELIEGENLEQLIARRAPISISMKLVYAAQACRALDYAHKRGIVHRDIKPGNVMVGKDGSVRVVDFGIARVLDASKTQTGMLIGTFAYMSPEQYHGEHADERSDIWSFGVLLYELLAYQRPFTGATPASLMHSICVAEPPSLSATLPDCPSELEVIMARVLQKSPSTRYQSMEDVLLELEPVCRRLQSQVVAEWVEQATQLVENGEFSEARDLVRQVLQVESGNQRARALLERTNVELKRISVRPKAQEAVEKGRAFLEQGKVQDAKIAVQSALHLDSTFEPAQELEKAVLDQIEKARQVAEWIEAAKRNLAEGLPDEAEALVSKALAAEPANQQVLNLRQQVLRENAERERRQQLLEALHLARGLWTSQDYDGCIESLTKLQAKFPGEDEVSRLLETVREDHVEQQKQQALLESRNLLAARRHDECISLLTELQKRIPRDEEIPRLLDDVRKDQKNQQRLQGLADARIALTAGRYDSCIALLTSLRAEFPQEPEISKLLDIAQHNQREQLRQAGLAEARKLLSARHYEDSAAALTNLEKQFPADEEIAKLFESLRAEQAEQRKQESLAQARKLLQSRSYDKLSEVLASLQREFPDDGEIRRLQNSAREEQAEEKKQEGLEKARRLLESRNYDKLFDLLASLQSEFPSEAEIERLRNSGKEEQAEQKKQDGLGKARKLLESRSYDELYESLDALQQEFPNEDEFDRLRKAAQREQAEYRKREKLSQARKLLTVQRYDESIDLLSELQKEFAGEAEISRLLDSARIDRAERQKQQKLAEARSHLAAQAFPEALASLDALNESHPNDGPVLKLRTLVEREQEKHARAMRMQRELDVLKKLSSEKRYADVLAKTRQLLTEFPNETTFVRLAEYAKSQQAAIERENLLRKTLEEARTLYNSGQFEEAIGACQAGLKNFPAQPELLALYQQGEGQQHKLRVRQQIEQRVREIRVKINREKFSEAIDLAQQTLVTLGPDTDLSQLLSSAQVEFDARAKKRTQEKSLETIRTLIESKNFDAAGRSLDEACESQVLDTFDPRIQRLAEQIKDAKTVIDEKMPANPTSIPPSVSREYAFLQAAPPSANAPATENASTSEIPTPQGSAGAATLPPPSSVAVPPPIQPTHTQPAAPVAPKPIPTPTIEPPDAKPVAPPVVVPPARPVAPAAEPPVADASTPTSPISRPRTKTRVTLPPVVEPPKEPAKQSGQPISTPASVTQVAEIPSSIEPSTPPPSLFRKPAVIGAAVVVVAIAGWLGLSSLRTKQEPTATAPSSAKISVEPTAPPVDPLEQQQRAAITEADKLVGANELDGALRKLQQAAAISGPLNADIQKRITTIQESQKDASLRQLRQREAVLWEGAMNRVTEGKYPQAERELRDILSLPSGGAHREEAQNYLNTVIPQRMQQGRSSAAARKSLEQGDFSSARSAADLVRQQGGDPRPLVADIDKAEKSRLTDLESQLSQLRQGNDDASIQQLKSLLPKFQALAGDGSSMASEAATDANNTSSAISDAQSRSQKKSADAAFQQVAQKYQQAVSANDKNSLTASRRDLQSLIQNGGPHTDEAQQYLTDVNARLAVLNQPPPPVATAPAVKPATPPAAPATGPSADNNTAILSVIHQYEQAFDQRDANALRQVWPSLGSRYARYQSTFAAASAIVMRVQVDTVEVSQDGTTATASGQFSQDFTPKGGKSRRVSNSTSFRLSNTNGSWIITDVQ